MRLPPCSLFCYVCFEHNFNIPYLLSIVKFFVMFVLNIRFNFYPIEHLSSYMLLDGLFFYPIYSHSLYSPITVQHTYLQTRKRCFRTPSVCFIFYLLIPATFCCTHSPMLRRKCSNIFIPLIVNCFMKSYAFSSFTLKLRFSVFSSSFCRFKHSFSYRKSIIFSKYAFSRSPELVFLK